MKKLINISLLILTLCFSYEVKSQCNTNVTICTPGVAGPFNFIPASANPSSCMNFAFGPTASNYAYIVLPISQGGDLNLLIDGNNNTGFIDVSIYDITGESDPCSALGVSTEIGCHFAANDCGCNEFGNNFPCISNMPAPNVSTGDVLMILIEDFGGVQSNFTLELSTVPGSAQIGPPNATISTAGPFLDSDAPYTLSAVNGGGVWTASCGTCVDPVTGEFDPVAAGVGTHQICYNIGIAPCSDNDCIDIDVVDNCTNPILDPIADIKACDSYIFPPITGANLSGNEAYYTGTGGTGTQYNAGDTYNINGLQTFYVFCENVISSSVCTDETSFDITIDAYNPNIGCPPKLYAACFISEQAPHTNINEFIAAGGGAWDWNGAIDSTSFMFVNDVSDGNSCPETITRTYQISDTCGHISTCTQEIAIHDILELSMNRPNDTTIQCISDAPPVDLTFMDGLGNCTTDPVVELTRDTLIGTACSGAIWRAYRVTSICGYSAVIFRHTITIEDIINPTGNAPLDTTVQCIADVPPFDITSVTSVSDNCTANPTVTYVSDVSDGNTCPETITRTYNIADDCGNDIDVIQTITINDDINPTGNAPADITVQCTLDVPAFDISTLINVSDNCTTNPTVTHVNDVSDGNSCPEIITRTYNIADDCGNDIDVIQTITINDDTNPTATAPADITVQCALDVPAVDIASVTNVSDNCTANPTITHVGDVSSGNACPKTITRTYNIEDDCGNDIDVIQVISVNDNIDPTGNAPADLTVECANEVPTVDISTVTNVSDNCTTNPTVTHVSDVSSGNTCPKTITRTYNIEDDCGNDIDVIQVISVNDNTNPTGNAPADLTVECINDVPAFDVNTVTNVSDNCTTNPTVTHVSDVSSGNTCPKTITRTYNIEDDCGNDVDVIQIITINDNTNPTGNAPADITVQCINDVPVFDISNVTNLSDNCSANPTVTHVSDVSNGNTCPKTISRTYNIADNCGNDIDVVQTITINDDINPTGNAPADITVQCALNVPAFDISTLTNVSDNCTINPSVTHVGDVSDGNTCPEIITRTYNIADDCGNDIDVIQTITINDDINPIATAPADITVQCALDVPIFDISTLTNVSDNCTTNPTITHVGDVSDGNTCPEIITRTYNIADDCGNDIDVIQTITINDDIDPTASNPASLTVECLGDVPAPDLLLVDDEADNCTLNPTVAFVSENSDGNTCNGEEITRVYSVTDDCGNSIDVSHTIIIDAYTPSFTVSSTDPTTCDGTEGTIILSGLDISTDYKMSYNGGGVNVITTNASGEYIITGLSEGIFVDFTVSDVDCSTCSSTENVTMTLTDPLPPIVNAGADFEECEDETITLTAGNPDGANLSWNNGITDGVGFIPPIGTTNYIVTAELVNCFSYDTVEVTIHPLPNVVAGNDIEVCEDEKVTLTASGDAATYSWDNGIADDVSFTPTLGITIYTLTGVSAFGCEDTDEVEVTVLPKPNVDFAADITEGCVPEEIFFSNLTLGNSKECIYTIDGTYQISGCDISHIFNESGCFDVNLEVELQNGCKDDLTMIDYICIDDYPIAKYTVSPDELSTFENEADFNNNSTGATTYEWDFGDQHYSDFENPSHIYNVDQIESGKTIYETQLIAYSNLGCADTANINLPFYEDLIYYIPNSFTPDKDKYNETFKPVFQSGFDPDDYHLSIYNRWGELLFESNDANYGWDGSFGINGGGIVKDGVYIWKIDFKETRNENRVSLSGHVNLIR